MIEPLRRTSITLINLDRDRDRLAHMDEILRQQGLAYSRFAAIDGRQLDSAQSDYVSKDARRHLSRNEAGCLLSHLAVWDRISKQSADFGLVLEDDLHVQNDFGEFIRFLDDTLTPEPREIHRFETFFARVTLRRKPDYAFYGRQGFKLYSNHAGAAAYLLSKETAGLLVRHADRFRHLPDTEMFDPERRVTEDLRIIQWDPAPCVQDMNLKQSAQTFASNLEPNRSDHRLNVTKSEGNLSGTLKSLLRPIYTRLYSVLLAPKGRMRREIGFG